MSEKRTRLEGEGRTREPAKAKLALAVLLRGGAQGEKLSKVLREQRIPRSTYYWVAARLGASNGDVSGAVWALTIERRKLVRRVQSLEQELRIVQEALGKPWQRWQPGGPP